MAEKHKYELRIGRPVKRTKEIIATPQQAAREAARYAARGTLVRTASIYDQPKNMELPTPVSLIDESGAVVMSCQPSILPSSKAMKSSRGVKYTFAKCTIKPGFKRLIHKTKRKRKG